MGDDLAAMLGEALRERGATIGTAESCTGGLIASTITDTAGSSAYMRGGVVAYDNDVKMRVLGVPEQTLIAHGAVSEQTAAAMARGVRALLTVDYALSVTGIAGPGGGTASKPVGLTYIGLAGADDLMVVARHVWAGDRVENKVASVRAALELALKHLRQQADG
ncbi:MAG: CinA family protein [Anaerolineaceae bacterium]|nr:MAG: CinA family protein [Anaerolineaceae bacterium]